MGERMTNWTPVFVLPNIPLETAIGCDIAALAPAHDRRVGTLKRTHPALRRFLNRFADNFGQKFEPSVLILNADAPPIFRDITALASFRDLISLSAVTHGRALALRYPSGHRLLFGEAFAIYPWMLDRHYEDVVGSTPAILGTHELIRFKGQSSPALFRTSLGESDIDQPLLAALIARWRRRYESAAPAWEDIALMRSLTWRIMPLSCRPGRIRRSTMSDGWFPSGSALSRSLCILAEAVRPTGTRCSR
jgi:hypothetical protein